MADNKIIDIDLSATARTQIRIDKDDNRIIALDLSDMTIASRLDSVYKELDSLMSDVSKTMTESPENMSDDEKITFIADRLNEIDRAMREKIDYLFDANVCEVCAPTGSMYDVFDGMFRFEYIIDKLTKLYEDNLNSQFKAMKARMSKHTSKYTKK